MIFSRLAGTGSYLPSKILSNKELESTLDTTDEWIQARTGICQRHIAATDDTSATMGAKAAKEALTASGIAAEQIDLIIVATSTPDRIFPSTACLIQNLLAIHGCPAFDVSAACAGFNYALTVANAFIQNGSAKNALVIGTEVMSRIINWQDRTTCILFADGAGAVVLSASESPGIHGCKIHADGKYQDLLYTPNVIPCFGKLESMHMKMHGSEVFKVAVAQLGNAVTEILHEHHLEGDAIDWLIPHQANIRIIEAVAKRLRLPMEKVVVTLTLQGNTSAASIPLALDTAVRDGRIKPGQRLLLESFGGGFAWGSALITY